MHVRIHPSVHHHLQYPPSTYSVPCRPASAFIHPFLIILIIPPHHILCPAGLPLHPLIIFCALPACLCSLGRSRSSSRAARSVPSAAKTSFLARLVAGRAAAAAAAAAAVTASSSCSSSWWASSTPAWCRYVRAFQCIARWKETFVVPVRSDGAANCVRVGVRVCVGGWLTE